MAVKAYWKKPAAFTGKPRLPHYKKSGGMCGVILTNQDCRIYQDENGAFFAKFPLSKFQCKLGKSVPGVLKEAKISPTHGLFVMTFVFDDGKQAKPLSEKPERICAIDLGVENLAAITNNVGAKSLLFKGSVIKSENQWYNKRMADITSKQTSGTTKKFIPTRESIALTHRRENVMNDFMHKVGKSIVEFCVENRIDTIVIGVNKGWKTEVNLGAANNQNFVQLPFLKLRRIIGYLAEWNGIRVVEQEESYTSKASFLDDDFIPVYGTASADECVFSGRRAPAKYNGMKRTGGFRGLYKTADGTIVNSDLNGSANIGRKAFPELFNRGTVKSAFTDVDVIVHPDANANNVNRENQLRIHTPVSKSKARRARRRTLVGTTLNVTPLG